MISPPISETLQEPRSQTVDALCGKHGAYVATIRQYDMGVGKPFTHQTSCPACTREKQEAEAAQKAADEARARRRRVEALINGSGIPARFADRSFASYRATEQGQKIALGVCRTFAEKWPERLAGGGSLLLTGGPGTGKTHLACAIGNEVMERHLASVVFGTVSSMLRHIKSTYSKESTRSEQDAINDLCRPDLLIVDEVGVQVGSAHEQLLMFEVLNSRYQELRPTILISNLNAEDLEGFLGQRVMDRYRECGAVLAFDWGSHRGR